MTGNTPQPKPPKVPFHCWLEVDRETGIIVDIHREPITESDDHAVIEVSAEYEAKL